MNVKDAQDVIMQAEAEFIAWLREAEQEWNEPQTLDTLRVIWAQLPPGAKTFLHQQDPKQYKEIEQFLKGE